jgi:hypothetical protein
MVVPRVLTFATPGAENFTAPDPHAVHGTGKGSANSANGRAANNATKTCVTRFDRGQGPRSPNIVGSKLE